VPQVLGRGQPAGGLLAGVRAQPPLAAGLPAGTGEPVRLLDDHAVRDVRHGQRPFPGVAFGIGVAPRAQRGEPDAHRPGRADQAVHHAERRVSVRHRQLAFEHDVADPPAPAGQAVGEVEALQVPVARGIDGAGCPFVHAEAHARA
jgi:hypothetical protein